MEGSGAEAKLGKLGLISILDSNNLGIVQVLRRRLTHLDCEWIAYQLNPMNISFRLYGQQANKPPRPLSPFHHRCT